MKKLLLCASVLLTSYGAASAQGWRGNNAADDFETDKIYVNGANGEGVYWWETTGGTTIKLTRPGTGAMTLTVANAGGCTLPGCYPGFGVDFGTLPGEGGASTPVTLDLSAGANIIFDIENTVNKPTFISVILTDINGVESQFEPNVSDVTSTDWPTAGPDRKGINGFSFGDFAEPSVLANVRKTITIDLSSVPDAIGGLTTGSYDGCNLGPATCPTTSYKINPAKIKSILFLVNFGKNDLFITEGTDHTKDTFIPGSAVTPYTGALNIYDFYIGKVEPVGVNEASANGTLNLYPNPAQDVLNVSFDVANGAEVMMCDIYGRTVYSTTANPGTTNITVNTSDFATGMYIVNVATKNGNLVRKACIK